MRREAAWLCGCCGRTTASRACDLPEIECRKCIVPCPRVGPPDCFPGRGPVRVPGPRRDGSSPQGELFP